MLDKYHSAVWGSFLENATLQLDKAAPIYEKNRDSERYSDGRRKLIAPAENQAACLAVVNSMIALESFANSIAYSYNIKNFSSWDIVPTKLGKLGISNYKKEYSKELSVCRDCIVHGHIWTKVRKSDENFNLQQVRSYMWKPFKSKLPPKYINNVNWRKRYTKKYQFSVIPIDISYFDAVKSFQLLISVFEDVYESKGVSWRPVLFPLTQEGYSQEIFQALEHRNQPTDWLDYFSKKLSDKDKLPVISHNTRRV